MDITRRTPNQGVINIIRFNWHFYVIAGVTSILLLLFGAYWCGIAGSISGILSVGIFLSVSISLVVSYYVYDRSDLYNFSWLTLLKQEPVRSIANVHAGFDETSELLTAHFPGTTLAVLDFYNPEKHTEVSIARARKRYPPYRGTVRINTSDLPMDDQSIDVIFNIFALHEVRDTQERTHFLKEQKRTLRDGGKIVLVEHLRDLPNFLAYNIGFFHFLPLKEWNINFQEAGLVVHDKFKITPFITVFILT